jgi:hypothetical protein
MTHPDTPGQPLLASVTQDTVDVAWSPPYNGGQTILEYQIGYGTSAVAPTLAVNAISPQTVVGLAPGEIYFFYVRARNAAGYSTWSKPAGVRTVAGAYIDGPTRLPSGGIMNGGTFKQAVPYVRVGGVWKTAEVWVNNQGTWTRVT